MCHDRPLPPWPDKGGISPHSPGAAHENSGMATGVGPARPGKSNQGGGPPSLLKPSSPWAECNVAEAGRLTEPLLTMPPPPSCLTPCSCCEPRVPTTAQPTIAPDVLSPGAPCKQQQQLLACLLRKLSAWTPQSPLVRPHKKRPEGSHTACIKSSGEALVISRCRSHCGHGATGGPPGPLVSGSPELLRLHGTMGQLRNVCFCLPVRSPRCVKAKLASHSLVPLPQIIRNPNARRKAGGVCRTPTSGAWSPTRLLLLTPASQKAEVRVPSGKGPEREGKQARHTRPQLSPLPLCPPPPCGTRPRAGAGPAPAPPHHRGSTGMRYATPPPPATSSASPPMGREDSEAVDWEATLPGPPPRDKCSMEGDTVSWVRAAMPRWSLPALPPAPAPRAVSVPPLALPAASGGEQGAIAPRAARHHTTVRPHLCCPAPHPDLTR